MPRKKGEPWKASQQDKRDVSGKPHGGKQQSMGQMMEAQVLEMDQKGFSERSIVSVTGVSRGGVRGVLARAGRINCFKKETMDKVGALIQGGLTAKETADKLGLTERTVYSVSHYIAKANELRAAPDLLKAVIVERISVGKRYKPGKYMVICDLHILFHDEEALQQCLSVKGDFDGCVIAGDLVDEYWISHFRKEGYVPHHKEVLAATTVIELLIKRFGRVLYCMGNHEDRRWKQLLESATPVANLAEDKAPDIYKALEKTRNWFYNEMAGIDVHSNWWVTICNERIIISHPDRFMAVPGNAAKGVVEHFFNHRKPYRLDNLDAMLMGHTHRLDNLKHRLGIWTCELPCMCGILPYQSGSRASSSGSIDTGFFVLTTHKDGALWFNESRAYLLEKENDNEEED
jgi:predicted phosphodiesterase